VTPKATTTLDALYQELMVRSRRILAVPGSRPEVSLYGAFQNFLVDALTLLRPAEAWSVTEQVGHEAGVPDFRVGQSAELLGWVELKAVIGKDLDALQGHDKDQVERFVARLTNVILTNGWDWRLFWDGKQVGLPVRLGDPSAFAPKSDSRKPEASTDALAELMRQFMDAPLHEYSDATPAVIALASRARSLRSALSDLSVEASPTWLRAVYDDFHGLLYKNGQPFTWDDFVDAYAQLLVFGALLWRLETNGPIGLDRAVGVNSMMHPLLAQGLGLLWQVEARPPSMVPLLEELCATVNLIQPSAFTRSESAAKYVPDPLVQAYEPFFRNYDPARANAAGVYYTPPRLVSQITSGVDLLLQRSLGASDGVLDAAARFLDPATGTGTFLLGLIDTVALAAREHGWPIDQTVREVVEDRLWAFELLPGPYAIAHQRLAAALAEHGILSQKPLPVFLTDTLASPEAGALITSEFGPAGREITKERRRADHVKEGEAILVVLGNPPWERVLGGGNARIEEFARTLQSGIREATPLADRVDLKSTWDLYVWFWAWALWALQTPETRKATSQIPQIDGKECHGLVAYVTNRTWISGPSLGGLRRIARNAAKEVWVMDLGGDGRGAHGAKSFAGGDDNVFDIQVGVAIVWIVCERGFEGEPIVRYRRVYGKRAEKYRVLEKPFDADAFEVVKGDSAEPFVPAHWGNSTMENAPSLDELFVDPPGIGIQTARDTARYSPVGTRREEVLARVSDSAGHHQLVGSLADWAELPTD
jgi:hypothetical protein